MKKLAVIAVVLAALSPPGMAQGWDVPQPSSGLMPNPNVGKPLYEKNCAACHGAALNGSDKGPPLVHKVYEPSHHSDIAFQIAARHGMRAHHWKFGDMPPVAGVSADEVAHITAYVRMLQRRAGIR